MIIRGVELQHVCGVSSRFPETELPEIAFAGRSNVGKSSLINALLNRKSLARTSAKPGKTQTINYYHVLGDTELFLVDLPGYGYTTAAVEIRQQWGKMIERYLRQSIDLRAVLLLLDIRHAPSANDRQMYDWICAQGFTPLLVATKQDKIGRNQIAKQLRLIRQTLKTEPGTEIIPFSSLSKAGRDELWEKLEEIGNRPRRTRLL